MKIKMLVEFDYDPFQYANIYGITPQEAEGEIPGYLATMLQEGVNEAWAVGDRRHWIKPVNIPQEV